MEERQPWDYYFFDIAKKVASRSTCVRRKVGAVAVNPRMRIIGTGYNGAPSGMEHCTDDTCVRKQMNIPSGTQLDLCKAIHAEANIVLQLGQELENATVYCTTQPCTSCLKLLFGAKVARICWLGNYDDPYAKKLMNEWGTGHLISIGNGDLFSELIRWDIWNRGMAEA